MKVERFSYKDRSRKGRKTWAVKIIVTGEEKENLEKGSLLLGDEFISDVVGRMDVYVPVNEEEMKRFGSRCFWFWIYENEMSIAAFSLLFCLTAKAHGITPAEVRKEYIEN